jgi:hypothetical protein
MNERRKNYDVTNTVDVSQPRAVLAEVSRIVLSLYPDSDSHILDAAFADFEAMFRGQHPDYLGCDTPYHDTQHSLDVCLATARLYDGYERKARDTERLGSHRMIIGIVVALFHDCGYLRDSASSNGTNGAIYTKVHVGRGGEFLKRYLPEVSRPDDGEIAAEMIQFTGFERSLEELDLPDRPWTLSGHMVGTADLIAQMSDRCYLEKCRDYLFPEFVLGGEASRKLPDGSDEVLYADPNELLRKTPLFYQYVVEPRLEDGFEQAYKHAETHFGGRNLYMDKLQANLGYLDQILNKDDFTMLRRKPVCFLGDDENFDPNAALELQPDA